MGADLISTADKLDNIAAVNAGLVTLAGAVLFAVGTAWVITNRGPIGDNILDAVAAVGHNLPQLPARTVNPPYTAMHRLHDDKTPKPFRIGVQAPIVGRGRHWAVGEEHGHTGLFPTVQLDGADEQDTAEVTR